MLYDEEFNGRVFVPSNIRQNKQSIIGKFDLRDIVFIFMAAGIFAVIFFILNRFLGNNTALAIALVFSLPVLYAGFAKFDGLKIEDFLLIMRTNKMLSSKVRINNSDNIYEILEKYTQKDKTKKTITVRKKKDKKIFFIFENIKKGKIQRTKNNVFKY